MNDFSSTLAMLGADLSLSGMSGMFHQVPSFSYGISGDTPQKSDIDTKNRHSWKEIHFPTHDFGALQPLVFGGVIWRFRNSPKHLGRWSIFNDQYAMHFIALNLRNVRKKSTMKVTLSGWHVGNLHPFGVRYRFVRISWIITWGTQNNATVGRTLPSTRYGW